MSVSAAAALIFFSWASTCLLLFLVRQGAEKLPPGPAGRRLAVGGLALLILSIWGWQRELIVPYGTILPESAQFLTGDEPDYLLTALSLARDGDFDIHNNIVNGDYQAFQNQPVGGADFTVFNRLSRGRLENQRELWGPTQLMLHRPGTSAFLAPVFFLANGNYRWWACFAIALFAVLALLAIVQTFLRLGTPRPHALLAALIVVLSPPVYFYGGQIYPEMIVGALLGVSAALLFIPGPPPLAGAFLLAAAIWFSDRALPATGILAAVLVWRQGSRWRRGAALVVIGASALGFAFYCLHRFGVPWPIHHNEKLGFSFYRLPARLAQVLLDRQQGWVWLFPTATLLPAIAAAAWRCRRQSEAGARWATLGALALTLVLVATFDDWRGGVNPRGRYYVIPQWLFAVLLLDRLRAAPGRSARAMKTLIALGALSLCTLPWLIYHPNWWYRRYHPLFGWQPLASLYDLLPDLPDGAPVLEWVKAALWGCIALVPLVLWRSPEPQAVAGSEPDREDAVHRRPPSPDAGT